MGFHFVKPGFSILNIIGIFWKFPILVGYNERKLSVQFHYIHIAVSEICRYVFKPLYFL